MQQKAKVFLSVLLSVMLMVPAGSVFAVELPTADTAAVEKFSQR